MEELPSHFEWFCVICGVETTKRATNDVQCGTSEDEGHRNEQIVSWSSQSILIRECPLQ